MWRKLKHLYVIITVLPMFLCAHAADNMRFHGTLVAQPCVIKPGEEVIPLDFGTVIDKYLYQNQRTSGQQFALHLSGCDLSLGTSVAITFTGLENFMLPGLLALDASSQASGIAIGIETQDGAPLPINKAEITRYPLSVGDNFIRMQAYVQAEPAALTNRTIAKGPFSAVVTFSLAYE
jgi:type 1 fimbria pilin